MATLFLTDPFIRSLRPLSDKEAEYRDRNVRGLTLRLSAAGKKTWTVQYRVNGRTRRMTLGYYDVFTLADARRRAREALYEVAVGKDPAADKQDALHAETFADLAKKYMERHGKFKRPWREDQRMLYGSPHKKRTGKLPHVPIVRRWGAMKVREISRRHVRDLLDDIATRAPIQANRVLAVVRKMFNFAIERDWLDLNPCVMIKRVVKEQARDRVLTEDEIRSVWSALDHEQTMMAGLIRLRLLTAQRGGELHGARWEEFDLVGGWWTIPASRSKNKLSHRVPLSPPALRIVKNLHELTGKSEWVFPSPVKKLPHLHHAQKAFERLVERSGVKFRGHDLRRTAASLMVGGGVPRLVVSKILNHVETGITAVYDRHGYDAEKRAALDFWGDRLEAIIKDGTTGRVLRFEARR
jgi:integrase